VRIEANTTVNAMLNSQFNVTREMSAAFDAIQSRYVNNRDPDDKDSYAPRYQGSDCKLTDDLFLLIEPIAGEATSFVLSAGIALSARGKGVAVFSTKHSVSDVALQIISVGGNVDISRLRTGRLEDKDWPGVTSAIRQLRNAPMSIEDVRFRPIDSVRSRMRQLANEGALHTVILDNVDGLIDKSPHASDETMKSAAIVQSLRDLASECRFRVLAISSAASP
jgi:replicative DNA helicase